MKHEEILELLAYMVSSAAGLRGEPAIYGSLRLIEASQRLSQMLIMDGGDANGALAQLVDMIEMGKNECMYDQEKFYTMLNAASAKLVECF